MTECENCGRTLPSDGDPDETLCDSCAQTEIESDPALSAAYHAAIGTEPLHAALFLREREPASRTAWTYYPARDAANAEERTASLTAHGVRAETWAGTWDELSAELTRRNATLEARSPVVVTSKMAQAAYGRELRNPCYPDDPAKQLWTFSLYIDQINRARNAERTAERRVRTPTSTPR